MHVHIHTTKPFFSVGGRSAAILAGQGGGDAPMHPTPRALNGHPTGVERARAEKRSYADTMRQNVDESGASGVMTASSSNVCRRGADSAVPRPWCSCPAGARAVRGGDEAHGAPCSESRPPSLPPSALDPAFTPAPVRPCSPLTTALALDLHSNINLGLARPCPQSTLPPASRSPTSTSLAPALAE